MNRNVQDDDTGYGEVSCRTVPPRHSLVHDHVAYVAEWWPDTAFLEMILLIQLSRVNFLLSTEL